MNLEHLSSYQNPEGLLQDRLAPRTAKRLENTIWLDIVKKRTVLDLGCNNGYFTREALKRGARRAVGVDESLAVVGARELAKEEGVPAEFWQADLDSKEFRRFCPKFEVVLLLSVLTHVKDKEEFLQWLDGICTYALVFESNHGEKNKEHIKFFEKGQRFERIEYLGPSDIPEKPHHLWLCWKTYHELRYPQIPYIPVEFVPIEKIWGWTETSIMNQKAAYPLDSDKFRQLKQHISKNGIEEPILLEEDYRGFQGSHRYFAARQLGYKEVPCKVLRGLNFEHLKR